MYGFTHPIVVKKKTEIHRKGKAPETRETDIYEPGTISEEELQKRSREYQQNAVLMDRLRGMESYSKYVHLQQVDSLVKAYGRQKDLKGFSQLGRVLNAHSHGKSAEQCQYVKNTHKLTLVCQNIFLYGLHYSIIFQHCMYICVLHEKNSLLYGRRWMP